MRRLSLYFENQFSKEETIQPPVVPRLPRFYFQSRQEPPSSAYQVGPRPPSPSTKPFANSIQPLNFSPTRFILQPRTSPPTKIENSTSTLKLSSHCKSPSPEKYSILKKQREEEIEIIYQEPTKISANMKSRPSVGEDVVDRDMRNWQNEKKPIDNVLV